MELKRRPPLDSAATHGLARIALVLQSALMQRLPIG